MTLYALLALYLSFRIKQYVCDFLLQTSWMALGKGDVGRNGYVPLFVHAGIHGVGTLIIFLIFLPHLWWFSLVDVVVHAAIDRTKARLTHRFQWTSTDTKFWWALGLDQEAHNITHLLYICLIVAFRGLIV